MITVEEAPPTATIKENHFNWVPGYDYVVRKDTFISKLLARNNYLNKKLSPNKRIETLYFVASDGESQASKPVTIAVKNLNQPPQITNTTPEPMIQTMTKKPILFSMIPVDPDGENVTTTWDFGLGSKKIQGTNKIKRTFTTPGVKVVKVTISDGRDTTSYEWKILVKQQTTRQTQPQQQVITKTYLI